MLSHIQPRESIETEMRPTGDAPVTGGADSFSSALRKRRRHWAILHKVKRQTQHRYNPFLESHFSTSTRSSRQMGEWRRYHRGGKSVTEEIYLEVRHALELHVLASIGLVSSHHQPLCTIWICRLQRVSSSRVSVSQNQPCPKTFGEKPNSRIFYTMSHLRIE
jgi:hypothetical protein